MAVLVQGVAEIKQKGMAMRLYTSAGSRGFRATWTISELGMTDMVDLVMLPFPPRAFVKGYFAVNPLGTIPALELDDGYIMTESSAISEYLAEQYGEGQLSISPGEIDRSAYLDFLHHADATLTFPQTVYLRFAKFERERGLAEAGEAYGEWFGKRLQKVDARLQDRDYLCVGRFTAADIAIGYALHLTQMTELAHLLTPRLSGWLEGLRARPGFQRAVAWEAEVPVRKDWPLEG